MKIRCDLSVTIQARKEWNKIFKVLKEKETLGILYPDKLSSENEGEIKNFLKQEKFEGRVASRSALQKILEAP